MNFHKQVSIALLCCLAGCAIGPQTVPAPIAAERSSNDVPAGKKLYAQHCAACHGVDALGGTRAPSLHTPSVQSMPGSALVQFLADGDLRNGMPSWSRLPEERRWQLARYIESLSPSNMADHRPVPDDKNLKASPRQDAGVESEHRQ